ncbi:hypothetical protein EJ03DRAFT_351537 [Teratosphaeria nubilosa]|uniref:Uncharacterized protein n=1 Tax=Teratosphaeria nubilosa TaxID=161662 RepID=A0A6G1L8P4_9PEZI|nr:hypothetical protein EJ03DRAFT_351537 [Teratosphaeria nubilosa]
MPSPQLAHGSAPPPSPTPHPSILFISPSSGSVPCQSASSAKAVSGAKEAKMSDQGHAFAMVHNFLADSKLTDNDIYYVLKACSAARLSYVHVVPAGYTNAVEGSMRQVRLGPVVRHLIVLIHWRAYWVIAKLDNLYEDVRVQIYDPLDGEPNWLKAWDALCGLLRILYKPPWAYHVNTGLCYLHSQA